MEIYWVGPKTILTNWPILYNLVIYEYVVKRSAQFGLFQSVSFLFTPLPLWFNSKA